MTEKYRKSPKQVKKERERRHKLCTFISDHPPLLEITQSDLAREMGCSLSTVRRDLEKLGSSRWGPFKQIGLKDQEERDKKRIAEEEESKKHLDSLTSRRRLEYNDSLLTTLFGRSLANAAPGGKSFTNEYQPRWRRWGGLLLKCPNCGYVGKTTVSGRWRQGETMYSNCPNCSRPVPVTRPEPSLQRYEFTTECGNKCVYSTTGFWRRDTTVSFTCDFPCTFLGGGRRRAVFFRPFGVFEVVLCLLLICIRLLVCLW